MSGFLAFLGGLSFQFAYPYPDPFANSFRDEFSNFAIAAVAIFGIFIAFVVIIKLVSMNASDQATAKEPDDTPYVRTYATGLLPDAVIEPEVEKYSKEPQKPTLKRLFEPHEIVVPVVQTADELKRERLGNVLKFCVLMLIWVGISVLFGSAAIYAGVLTYPIMLYFFSRWRKPVIDPTEKCTETKIVPSTGAYQPVDLNDLLYGWLTFQKKSFAGLFKQIPVSDHLSYSHHIKSTFAEIEADAEYFTISHYPKELPYNRAAGQAFFKDPFPVTMPTEFGDSSQEFPCQDTLEKRVCSTCSGSGKVTCSRCHGSGKVTCSSCGGRGYRTSTRTVYETRFGERTSHTETVRHSCSCFNGHVTCSTCSGSGHVICSRCQGEGSVGVFTARKYEFHHVREIHVLKEVQDRATPDVDITDVPNEDGRLIVLDNAGRSSGSIPDESPTISQETIQELKSKKEEVERRFNALSNLIFDQFAYREFPELAVQFTSQGRNYTVKGRGYKPLQKKYFQMDKLPVSIPRLLLFGFLPPLLWILLFVVF